MHDTKEFWQAANDELTEECWAALTLLRHHGFAVCAFTPTELRGADPRRVSDRLVELGWEVIDALTDIPLPDDKEDD